jgi:hypothetical protein
VSPMASSKADRYVECITTSSSHANLTIWLYDDGALIEPTL